MVVELMFFKIILLAKLINDINEFCSTFTFAKNLFKKVENNGKNVKWFTTLGDNIRLSKDEMEIQKNNGSALREMSKDL